MNLSAPFRNYSVTLPNRKSVQRSVKLQLEDRAKKIDFDHIIRGYILATPKRDHKFLRKKLDSMKIDITPYERLFD